MKKIINIIAAALLLLVASSCGRKVTYEYSTYATLESSSYSFDEDVQEVTIPVTIYNPTGAEVQLSVNTVDGKAKEDVDFEIISPISGVLTFAPGETVQEVVIGINERPNDRTGSLDFTLVIESLTEGFNVGNVNTAKLTIKDLDHKYKDFIGEWSATATGESGANYSWTMTVEPDDSDEEILLVKDLDPTVGFKSSEGYNIFDAVVDSNRSLRIKAGSFAGVLQGADYAIYAIDQAGYLSGDVYLDISSDRHTMINRSSWIVGTPNEYGSISIYDIMPAGIVFTKK